MALILLRSKYVENIHAWRIMFAINALTGADDTASVIEETRLLKDLLDPTLYDVRAVPKYKFECHRNAWTYAIASGGVGKHKP